MKPLLLPGTVAGRLRASHWRIIVTGASGWLGQAALELLVGTLGDSWQERVVAFGSGPRQWFLRDGTRVAQRPLSELPTLERAPSLLLHFAYLTREKTSTVPVEAYITTNRAISRLADEGGALVGVERIFATSSGAVHAALARPDDPEPSLLYGRLKLEDEALFEVFAHAERGRRAFVARLFNLSGPYINKLDSFAMSSFIRQARDGCIRIRAQHPVVRSYTSVANLLGVAFAHLLADDAEPHLLVETAGEREVEVGELAQAVRGLVAPDAAIERVAFAQEPMDHYVGDGARYRAMLALHGIAEHPLERQILDTAAYLFPLDHPDP